MCLSFFFAALLLTFVVDPELPVYVLINTQLSSGLTRRHLRKVVAAAACLGEPTALHHCTRMLLHLLRESCLVEYLDSLFSRRVTAKKRALDSVPWNFNNLEPYEFTMLNSLKKTIRDVVSLSFLFSNLQSL